MWPPLEPLTGEDFATALVKWQGQHGRQTLPWQHTGDAYKVWLSEIMLQQTQVATVMAYYQKFLAAYPTVADLAAAAEQDVMQLWAGLGYYTRARNLHACAKQVVSRFGGQFPQAVDDLESLPGIGQSTAGAIASLAHGVQAPILDGNVKRVFCRYYGVEGYPEQSAVKKQLWAIAAANVPAALPGQYNQALMDLGATRCTPRNPDCANCPLRETCAALGKGMVGQLPTPKPKKARLELYFVSLLVQDARGAVLLELQPEKGVWQGLWTPPGMACSMNVGVDDLAGVLEQWIAQYDLSDFQSDLLAQMAGLPNQPWLVHELTHRKMHFKVLSLNLAGVRPGFSKPTEKPVPKIVHKLMAQAELLAEILAGSAQGAVAQQNTLDF